MSVEVLSLVDIAELVLRETKEPLSVYDLYDKVCERKVVSEKNKLAFISQFYADITTSARFVYVGQNTWDLKDNQKIELWEKDGSYYKEYTEIELPEEYKEKPKPKAAKAPSNAKAKAKVKEEVVVVEEVKEEVIVEEVVVKPDTVKATQVKDATKDIDAEAGSEEFEDPFFNDFDEEKYNEYMDTYEDKYDKK